MPSEHQKIMSSNAEELSVWERKAERMKFIRAVRDKARAAGTVRLEPIDGMPGHYFEVFSGPGSLP